MILFLDDDLHRTAVFVKKIPHAITTETAQGMIELLKAIQSPVEKLFLDHDLGGEIYVDSNREDCGMEVVRWMVANKPLVDKVIVHTHNNVAGARMVELLSEANYNVMYIPFGHLMPMLSVYEEN